jgi:hypothetical protein
VKLALMTVLTLILPALNSCTTHREFILDAEVISMTKRHLPKGRDLKTLGNISTKWCSGDTPAFKTAGTNHGFIDQVTAKAQKLKRADFIVAPRFYMIDGQCMEIVGIAAVVR